jgi:NAD-dependent deacetylase
MVKCFQRAQGGDGMLAAFTGAGISKASGIPTFEELGDIRDKLSRNFFYNNPEELYKILLELKEISTKAKPNPAHIALTEFNIPVVTMNVDGLHKRAGTKRLIEIHGNLDYVYCPRCRLKEDFFKVKSSIYCNGCNTLLEPNVVLYGDSLDLYYNAIDLIGSAKELLVIGTSFYTSTAGDIVYRAELSGIKVTIINDNAEYKVKEYLNRALNKGC